MNHTVQKGDTLWKISKMHGISLEALIAANPQITNPDQIDVGMTVNVPGGNSMPAAPETQAPAPTTPVTEVAEELAPTELAPAPSVASTHAGSPQPIPTPAPAAEMGFPSAAKWDGLWKYVVKNGDTMHKIAKQVGVTLDQLKAANPQVANPESIYANQVLNIPATGMKSKAVNNGQSLKEQLTAPIGMQPVSPGPSLKEQMTAPIGMQPLDKEQLLQPKEMAPMEVTKPAVFAPQQPVMPLEPMPAPAPAMPGIDIMQFAPHIDIDMSQKQWQFAAPQPVAPPTPQVVSPAATAPATPQYPMMMYIPVTIKKAKKKKKCHKKKHKCHCHKKHHHHGHHHHHDHHHHMMMMLHQQQMMQQMPGMAQGMQATTAPRVPMTFYRDDEE